MSGPSNKPTIFVKCGTLITGLSAELMRNVVVVIEGSRITNIGKEGEIITPKSSIIDASDMTVMPGLIDGHIHITMSDWGSYEISMTQPITFTVINAIRNLQALLMAGFTTVKTVGDIDHVDIGLKKALERGMIRGPRLLCCGRAISTTGGHADMYFPSVENMPLPHSWGRVADGPDEVRKAVREELKAGADGIKFMHAGISSPELGVPGASQFTIEEMRAGVEVAHKLGARVCAHCLSPQAIKDSAIAGVDTIDHGHGIDEEAIRLIKEKGLYLLSTLSPAFARPRLSFEEYVKIGMPEATARKYLMPEFSREAYLESVRRAVKSGIKIGIGSDTGGGSSFHKHGDNSLELQLLVEAGLSEMEAIIAATKVTSEAIGIGQRVGTIERGKQADILVVNGNPLERISLLRKKSKIHMVIQKGEIVVDRQAIREPPYVYPVRRVPPYPLT